MNELALFAGIGGGILGGKLLGWRTICAVERDIFARTILLARQDDGILPPFPIWDDIETFDGRPWQGIVDVVSGGFPCQDISPGNTQGKGEKNINGKRSGLWSEMARIIGEVRPRFVFVENSSMLVVRGIDRVLADLSEMGFDAEWGVMGADDSRFPQQRKRTWILAFNSNDFRREEIRIGMGNVDDKQTTETLNRESPRTISEDEFKRLYESRFSRDAHGTPEKLDDVRAIGNMQVPRVVFDAWNILLERMNDRPYE